MWECFSFSHPIMLENAHGAPFCDKTSNNSMHDADNFVELKQCATIQCVPLRLRSECDLASLNHVHQRQKHPVRRSVATLPESSLFSQPPSCTLTQEA